MPDAGNREQSLERRAVFVKPPGDPPLVLPSSSMNGQLSLFEIPQSPSPANSLFLAILPDADTAAAIIDLGERLRAGHGLGGKLRPLDHLHITMYFLGNYPDLPADVLKAATLACEDAATLTNPFRITLDRAMSFTGKPGSQPFVLTSHDREDALQSFRQLLVRRLAKHGFHQKGNLTFKPHVTLLYGERSVPEEAIAPIRWVAGEVVLLNSLVGKTEYQRLGRWTFAG